MNSQTREYRSSMDKHQESFSAASQISQLKAISGTSSFNDVMMQPERVISFYSLHEVKTQIKEVLTVSEAQFS